jgi:hypothetical protein
VGQAKELKIPSENMELDIDMYTMIHFLDQPEHFIHHSHPMDISVIKKFDEDESFVFQSIFFDTRKKK